MVSLVDLTLTDRQIDGMEWNRIVRSVKLFN